MPSAGSSFRRSGGSHETVDTRRRRTPWRWPRRVEAVLVTGATGITLLVFGLLIATLIQLAADPGQASADARSSGSPSLAVSPNSAPAGAPITVTGANFPRAAVQLQWDGSVAGMPTAQANGRGSFQISFVVPLGSLLGAHQVGASASGTGQRAAPVAVTATSPFTVTAANPPAPIPTPIPTPVPTASPIATATPTAPAATPSPAATPRPTSTPASTPTAQPTASAGFVGDGAVEGTTDPSAVGVVEATRFIASSSGAVTSLSIYVDAANRATSFSLGLYSDGGSGPAALLAQGSRTGAESGAWNTVAIGGAAITQGTPYWIARLATAGGDLVTRVNTAVPNPDLVDARNMSALPASFAPGASYPHVTSIYAGTSAVSTPGPTPTPPAPTASPTAAPTSTPSTGSFVCTQVMGYSQTGNWYSQQVSGAFESVVNDARYQLLNFDGGAVWRWADPNYGGWFNAPYSGCASNGGAPDRVIFDVTESFWVDQAWSHAFDDYGGNPDVSVARVAQDIRNMLTTLRAKYPSVRQVYLQAVLGGPGGAVCSINDATGVSHQIRGTWNNSRIEDAIRQAVNGNAVVGPHFEVRTCSDFYDDGQYVGHLDTTAKGPIGQTIGAYYAARP